MEVSRVQVLEYGANGVVMEPLESSIDFYVDNDAYLCAARLIAERRFPCPEERPAFHSMEFDQICLQVLNGFCETSGDTATLHIWSDGQRAQQTVNMPSVAIICNEIDPGDIFVTPCSIVGRLLLGIPAQYTVFDATKEELPTNLSDFKLVILTGSHATSFDP
ncbi:MAG: hypothetical protein V2I33_19890 [Kangiellaceae bacterium]|jgi:hypothetical protein|nr:hypothetical protein [Kangiellaceae bacterium]